MSQRKQNLSTPTASAVTRSAKRMSGAAVFAGTRVPVKTLFEYLAAGDPLERFLDQFPDVSREQAAAVLEEAGEELSRRDE